MAALCGNPIGTASAVGGERCSRQQDNVNHEFRGGKKLKLILVPCISAGFNAMLGILFSAAVVKYEYGCNSKSFMNPT